MAFAQRGQLLGTQFQARNAPDAMVLLGGNGFPPAVFPYAKAGYLDPISSARLREVAMASFVKPALGVKNAVYARPMSAVRP